MLNHYNFIYLKKKQLLKQASHEEEKTLIMINSDYTVYD